MNQIARKSPRKTAHHYHPAALPPHRNEYTFNQQLYNQLGIYSSYQCNHIRKSVPEEEEKANSESRDVVRENLYKNKTKTKTNKQATITHIDTYIKQTNVHTHTH